MATITIGVDIGQNRDPTAICVSETIERIIEGRAEAHLSIRHLERLPLTTSYPAVARRLAAIVAALRNKPGSAPDLFVDATGLGEPVVDLLAEPLKGVRPVPVYFTHGDRRTDNTEKGRRTVTLGKAWLIARLKTLLQSGRLHLPDKMTEARILAKELEDFEVPVDQNANDRYGAFRVGTQDDLVTALGLATQGEGPPDSWTWAADYMRKRRAGLLRDI